MTEWRIVTDSNRLGNPSGLELVAEATPDQDGVVYYVDKTETLRRVTVITRPNAMLGEPPALPALQMAEFMGLWSGWYQSQKKREPVVARVNRPRDDWLGNVAGYPASSRQRIQSEFEGIKAGLNEIDARLAKLEGTS